MRRKLTLILAVTAVVILFRRLRRDRLAEQGTKQIEVMAGVDNG